MMHKLIKECLSGMKRKGCIDEKFKKRLKLEIKEIEDQNMSEYFLEALENNYKWEKNENNLLIPYLLDLVSEVDIDSPPLYEHGEFPDIDIDYLQAVRDYLKKDWAPKTFGFNNICSIGNYTTYGLKSALIDMARVHGKSREEVLALTTKMGLKDDDGKALTWEKAVESNENFAVYCENNPDVAEAAKRLVNRTRGRGTHAGGLIVSSSPINNLVPLCVGKDGLPVSAWTEGLHEQDLQPVGLIKFDMLVLSDLYRIACIVNSIKKRHGIDSICALPDQSDWTDLSYLNDKKALALANAGDTMGVFQFDSEGIRCLLKNGGVTSFDDMVAYNSLFRPGPLGMKMHERYCKRKKGEEEYEMHPLIKPILGQTYGVLCYQEQIMKMLNVVGDIPLKDCEIVRKAISKKKISKFMPYKEKFIVRGQKNLNTNREELENIWQQIESFAEYGFNKSHACAYSYIAVRLLWLKAHYPIEFYSNTLTLENNVDKVKLYMNDAKFHDIVVNPVTINKSGANFEIHDDEIYYGLSKVKGIGPEVAENIVSSYPYEGIVDFMHRFGTDARVVQPLIALGAFDDADKSTLHKFYEVYKDTIKKRKDSYKRFVKSMEKYKEELEEIVGSDKIEEVWNSWKPSEKVAPFDSFSITNQIFDTEKVWKKWKRTVERFLKKQRDFRESDSLTLKNFDPEQHYLSSEFEEIYDNPDKAEEIFYGFRWIHPIEKSNDYNNNYTLQSAMVEEGQPFTIQVMVLAYKKKTSRNNKTYFQLEVEDSNSNFIRINIWGNENERFGDEEFKVGNFLQLKLMPPSGGYKTYSLERLPMGWRERQQMDWKDPVYKDQDYRVIVMHKPESEKKTIEKEFADVGLLEID